MYRVAMTVFVEVPGSVKTPLHLWNRLRGFSKLRKNERKKERKWVSVQMRIWNKNIQCFQQMQRPTHPPFSWIKSTDFAFEVECCHHPFLFGKRGQFTSALPCNRCKVRQKLDLILKLNLGQANFNGSERLALSLILLNLTISLWESYRSPNTSGCLLCDAS